MTLLLLLFWVAVGFVAYTYFIFPGLVILRGLVLHRPCQSEEIRPRVSMLIAAHNEADSIGAKLDNVLSLDYPSDSLEVIVASDGSEDGTNAIVEAYEERGVTLLALPRVGKAPALNAAADAARGEILVFSDANSIYAADAIRVLVQPFADAKVGGVAGNQRYLRQDRAPSEGQGEKSYWRFDRQLKLYQSRAGNATSATGAIYAIRRSLFQAIPGGVTDDFYTSTGVIAQGYRLVFAPDAVAYEPVAPSSSREFERKVRVITRGLQAVLLRRTLLNPFRYGFYALQLFSHKVLRRMVIFPLLILAVLSPLLWSQGLIYRLATVAQAGFYGIAALHLLLRDTRLGRSKTFTLPFYFCMVNVACLLATFNLLRGRRIERWEPQRDEGEPLAGTATSSVSTGRGSS